MSSRSTTAEQGRRREAWRRRELSRVAPGRVRLRPRCMGSLSAEVSVETSVRLSLAESRLSSLALLLTAVCLLVREGGAG